MGLENLAKFLNYNYLGLGWVRGLRVGVGGGEWGLGWGYNYSDPNNIAILSVY